MNVKQLRELLHTADDNAEVLIQIGTEITEPEQARYGCEYDKEYGLFFGMGSPNYVLLTDEPEPITSTAPNKEEACNELLSTTPTCRPI